MKILVFSDSHGREAYMSAAAALENAGIVLFLGDGAADFRRLELPGARTFAVRGNCDPPSALPETREETLGGLRIFMTHGHRYGVKSGTEAIIAAAQRAGADILLFGHTHEPLYELRGGLHVLNPGSIGQRRYATVETDGERVVCRLKRL